MNLGKYINDKKAMKTQKELLAEMSADLAKLKETQEWESLERAIRGFTISCLTRLRDVRNMEEHAYIKGQLFMAEYLFNLSDIYDQELVTGEQE